LQKVPGESGRSVFVDYRLQPYPDQWAFLASVQAMAPHDIEPTILRATGGSHPLDVTFITEKDQQEPWKRTTAVKQRLPVQCRSRSRQLSPISSISTRQRFRNRSRTD